ncbi:MAG: sensor histidine kinase, partial [Sphingomicrobium sp.]
GQVSLTLGHTGNQAWVTVADQGKGIEPADQQRIFERFQRADEAPGGTGLGLAIARRLARSMGGDVTLESVAGQGARFTLSLPIQ